MAKQIIDAPILGNHRIAEGVYALELDYSENTEEIRPGQFVNVYLPRQDMLLPRPLSICRSSGTRLTLVYGAVGKGTQWLSRISGGNPEILTPTGLNPARADAALSVQSLYISTPLGNGYELPKHKIPAEGGCLAPAAGDLFASTSGAGYVPGLPPAQAPKVQVPGTAMLIGGGLGAPPMLELAHALKALGYKVIAVLGFREEAFLIDEMRKAGAEVYAAVEKPQPAPAFSGVPDGEPRLPSAFSDNAAAEEPPVFSGNVIELIRAKGLQADRYFACGPKAMLKAVTEYCIAIGKDVQVSLEERMGCGYGACVGCTCKVRAPGRLTEDKAACEERERSCPDTQKPGPTQPVDDMAGRKRVCKDGPVFWGSEVIFDA